MDENQNYDNANFPAPQPGAESAPESGEDGMNTLVVENAAEKPVKKKAPRENPGKVVLRIVISLVIIAVGIYLILFLVAKASRYDSIASMLNHMFGEMQLMWERINR